MKEDLALNAEPVKASKGQDTIMSEVSSTVDEASRATSLAPSKSLDTSRSSTRASTPTETPDTEAPVLPTTPKASHQVTATDDVPMIDISPGKHRQISSPTSFEGTRTSSSTQSEGTELPHIGAVAKGGSAVDPHISQFMELYSNTPHNEP